MGRTHTRAATSEGKCELFPKGGNNSQCWRPRCHSLGPVPPRIARRPISHLCAILACVQAIIPEEKLLPAQQQLAADLYALIVFLHKNCNADLFAALGTLELTLTQTKLLHHLESQERELTLKEAAELVHVSLPAASRTVDDLYRRGLVERHEDSSDRRMKRVSLTEQGYSAIRQLNAARLNGLEQFSYSLSEAEHASLSDALRELLRREEVAACRPDATAGTPR